MRPPDYTLLSLEDLENNYKNRKITVVKIQQDLLKLLATSLKDFTLQPTPEGGIDFLDKIIDHTAKIPTTIKESNLAIELQRESKDFIAIENELKNRRKNLFDTINIDEIDL